ncbi:MAG: ArdC family protein [Betaproteobacteria bacterium]
MRNVYQEVTDRIVAELEKGAAPWIKPWRTDSSADRNFISGKPYRGINRLLLGMQGRASPHWATFKQWQEKGGKVRKGEKAAHIVFFKPVASIKETEDGAELTGKGYCVIRDYCVFNAEQVDGVEIPEPAGESVPEIVRHDRAEFTLQKSGARIEYSGDAAFFAPSKDFIRMPKPETFVSMAHYYAVAFHELTHWTGHKSRLDRDLEKGKFGNPAYAFEELVAEMGAAFLCADHGIQGELRHAAYIQSWLKACRENDRAVFKAAALAQAASDYILQLAQAAEGERIAA